MLKAAGPDSRTRSLPVAFRPELVKVNVCTADCPGLTGPKSYGDGLNTSAGPVGRGAAAAVPVPGSTAAPASASVPATASARRHAVNTLRRLPDPPQYDMPSPPLTVSLPSTRLFLMKAPDASFVHKQAAMDTDVQGPGPFRRYGQPAPGTSTSMVRTWPLPGGTISDSVMPRHSAATMNSVVPSGPPRAQAKPPRSRSTVCSTVPPAATRTHRRLGTSAYQTAS